MAGLLSFLFFVSVGFAGEYVDFSCPEKPQEEECSNEDCCPEKFKKIYRDGEHICVYNGKYTHVEEDVDSEGNLIKVKRNTGNCVIGIPDGPASSWSMDSGGNSIEKSGTFKNGLLNGPSLTKNKDGIILGVSCHSVEEGESYVLWEYQQGELPTLAVEPDPELLQGEEYKEAVKEYKTSMDARKTQLKDMRVGSKFLKSLEKSCPIASDKFCGELPINGKRLTLKLKNKKTADKLENFIELSGKDPNEDVCENGLAKKYETFPLTNVDRVLEISSVSEGVASLSCRFAEARKDINESLYGKVYDDHWFIYQHIPKPASKGKNSTQEYAKALKFFKDTSKNLKKHRNACEKPTRGFCNYMENIDESKFSSVSKPGKDFCINGHLVNRTGDWKEYRDPKNDGWYPPSAGLRTLSTQMGVHEIQCIEPSSAVTPCQHKFDCGMIWYFSHDTPIPKPALPLNEKFEDQAEFKKAMEEHEAKLKLHTEQLSALSDFDKMIKPFLKLCKGNHINESYSDDLCAKFDQLEALKEKPKGLGFKNIYQSHCHSGFAVQIEGKHANITEDFETFRVEHGFHRHKIKPGYIEGECYPTNPKDFDGGLWRVTNEYPGKAPSPPPKDESLSPEEEKELLDQHKDKIAKHKRDMHIFKRKSKAIGNQKYDCREKGVNYCIASGECTEKGACKWSKQEEKCVVGSLAHCQQSLACIEEDRCKFSDGSCIR